MDVLVFAAAKLEHGGTEKARSGVDSQGGP
jgi:hypothetical protein